MEHHLHKPEGSFISYFSNLVKKHGGVNLAQGTPGFQPPVELRKLLSAIVDKNVHQYAPGIGNFRLLELIHKRYSKKYSVEKENFLVLQGATEAISLVYTYLATKFKGDFSALSFDPPYESYSQLPKIFGQKFINYSMNSSYSFKLSELKEIIVANNVKVVFISSPGNPFGKVWNKDEIDALVKLSHEQDFYIIFDAVYKDIYFNNQPYIPLNTESPNLFYVNSFSKMLCITGWRMGYLYAHEVHQKELQTIHDYIGLCAPSVLQEALVNYLEYNNFGESFSRQLRHDIKQSFNLLSETLSSLGFLIPPIQGGCFIWCQLPKEFADGFDFARNLYSSKGVAVIPGEHFSKNYVNWVRLNIARPLSEIEQAAELISQYISNT